MNRPAALRTAPLVIMLTPNAPTATLNVLDGQPAATIDAWMRQALTENMNEEELAELEDTLEALIPALVELRDHHGCALNLRTVTEHACVAGFARLAMDERLSTLNRLNCQAMARRHAVFLKRAVEKFRQTMDPDVDA